MKNAIKTEVQSITGFRATVKENKNVFTVSSKDSDKFSFGTFKTAIFEKFNVVRFDGGSFDIQK